MNPVIEWNHQALLSALPFAPLHPVVAQLGSSEFPSLQACNALLEQRHPTVMVHSGHALRFVPQLNGKLPFEAQYEPRCYLQGEVPTRANNWHDLLNALVWLTFPQAKAAINARHFQILSATENVTAAAAGSQRGAVRDALTLLDESGVIVPYANKALAVSLQNFQWKELFWQQRAQVQSSMGFYLFGHGLYEKALRPYVGMTAQGLLLPVQQEFFAWPLAQRLAHLDALLAEYLSAPQRCTSTRELAPVPLLGVPGWSAENEEATYYDNRDYFRSARHAPSAN